MTIPRSVWNTTKTKKIKTKEIRECRIDWNKDFEVYDILAFGFFGGGVVIFTDPSKEKCQEFIDSILPHEPSKRKKGHSESTWECKHCNRKVEKTSLSNIIDAGIPFCQECGNDMELMEETWKED